MRGGKIVRGTVDGRGADVPHGLCGPDHHRIPTNKTSRDDESGPHLTASAGTYEDARDEIYAQVPEGYRLTWVRRIN